MFDISVTERCQRILAEYSKEGDTVIDCTAGGGWDTLFLAGQVGRTGCVLSFDVQQQALDATEKLLGENGFLCKRISSPYEYISSTEHNAGIYLTNDSHENLRHYYSEPSVIMYNLGYLPGGDHNIVTTAGATLASVDTALKTIKKNGIISIVTYPGHEEGSKEDLLIRQLTADLPANSFEVLTIEQSNRSNAPVSYLIYKK